MEKRRQNVSCEQCRRSKKACDGFMINSNQQNLVDAALSTSDKPDEIILPCSYCFRTKKDCSLHPQWSRLQLTDYHDTASNSTGSSDGSQTSNKRQRVHPQHQHQQHQHDGPSPSLVDPLAGGIGGQLNGIAFRPSPSMQNDPYEWNMPLPTPTGPATISNSDSFAASSLGFDQPASTDPGWAPYLVPDAQQNQQANYGDMGLPFEPPFDGMSTIPPSLDNHPAPFGLPQTNMPEGLSWPAFSPSDNYQTTDPHRQHKRRRDCESDSTGQSCSSLSPFGLTSAVAASSNKTLITQSLLRIYNDVLENNLGCWLAESTCPYKVDQRKEQALTTLKRRTVPGAARDESQSEGGFALSNRMYRRVKKLDRNAHAAGLVKISRSEDNAASRALDLTIMAFATQWSQGNRRRQRFEAEGFWGGDGQDDAQFGDDQFEQVLQQSIWEQAKKALGEVAEVECFRVIYAELIFGLIQKPWACYDHPDPDEIVTEGDDPETTSIKSWVMPHILEILAEGGPPIALERAARKIHALKFRFESMPTSCRGPKGVHKAVNHRDGPYSRVSTEDRRTIGLIYWLAVMFDTVSASMNERPVVVSDEECQHDEAYELERERPKAQAVSRRWELDLYAQENSKNPSPLHWPCSMPQATLALSRSAAVKVLLWRYVSYLQTAIRKRDVPESIEETIQTTLAVYQYWNKTHGAFFRDLTANYETIPPRIKSWYPCIAIPWHLASLTLAELLEFVDDNQLGSPESSTDRTQTGLALQIRTASAIELSELASVAGPPQEDYHYAQKEQLPEFHFAVNESALLTEPWTVLLIRAFAKAALFHLTEAEDLQQRRLRRSWSAHDDNSNTRRATNNGDADDKDDDDYNEELQKHLWRSQTCISTLWFLGSKSEMARGLAKVLGHTIRRFGNAPRRVERHPSSLDGMYPNDAFQPRYQVWV